jgi:hypothetical protein
MWGTAILVPQQSDTREKTGAGPFAPVEPWSGGIRNRRSYLGCAVEMQGQLGEPLEGQDGSSSFRCRHGTEPRGGREGPERCNLSFFCTASYQREELPWANTCRFPGGRIGPARRHAAPLNRRHGADSDHGLDYLGPSSVSLAPLTPLQCSQDSSTICHKQSRLKQQDIIFFLPFFFFFFLPQEILNTSL